MVEFPITTGARKTAVNFGIPFPKAIDEEWLDDDIVIFVSGLSRVATIVVDFAYTVSTIVEYTFDSGLNWISLNNGEPVTGSQSRFIDVVRGHEINFRAKDAGIVLLLIVSSVP